MEQRWPLLSSELQVVNLGLEVFARDLQTQGVPVVQVDWRPPAGGDQRMASLLRQLDSPSQHPDAGDSSQGRSGGG